MIGIISLCLIGLVGAAEFPRDIPQCRAGDTQCLPGVIQQIVNSHPQGHRGLNIPPLDPMHLGAVDIKQGSQNSPVQIDLSFKNLELSGISRAQVLKVVGFERDPRNSKFEVTANCPRLTLKGDYKVNGKVLILPIQGAGKSVIHFENVGIVIKFLPRVTVRNGKSYVQTEKFKIDYDPKGIKLHFSNLFNGDRVLGDQMNQFLNENWRDILRELRPNISHTIKNAMKGVINSIFKDISYDDIYLP